jgi:hypothetical protein
MRWRFQIQRSPAKAGVQPCKINDHTDFAAVLWSGALAFTGERFALQDKGVILPLST